VILPAPSVIEPAHEALAVLFIGVLLCILLLRQSF
jgi:hypothetical protein